MVAAGALGNVTANKNGLGKAVEDQNGDVHICERVVLDHVCGVAKTAATIVVRSDGGSGIGGGNGEVIADGSRREGLGLVAHLLHRGLALRGRLPLGLRQTAASSSDAARDTLSLLSTLELINGLVVLRVNAIRITAAVGSYEIVSHNERGAKVAAVESRQLARRVARDGSAVDAILLEDDLAELC